jgi:Thaumatin family
MVASRQTRSRLAIVSALTLPLLAWTPAAASGQTRTFNLVNLCGDRVWVGTLGTDTSPTATTGWQLDRSNPCTSNNQCTGGQTCDTRSGRCQLVLSLPLGLSRLWPMTGCTFNASNQCALINNVSYNCCATGGCTYGNNASGQGQWGLNCVAGGEAPLTVAEFTLGATDFYDVSMVDGYNVPVEVRPASRPACPQGFADCRYWCGNPGGVTSTTGLDGCAWQGILGDTCKSKSVLRAVNPPSCSSNADCVSPSTCNPGPPAACQCTSDSGCASGQICGVGNNQFVGYLVCGTFAGCTSPKDLCVPPYFPGNDGAGTPAAAFDCSAEHRRTVACQASPNSCPFLIGWNGLPSPSSTCGSGCPSPTTCQQMPGTNPAQYACQEPCVNGSCVGMACTSDSDCTAGIFMLCDTTQGSPTYQQCVSTNASLFEGTGINGASCYASAKSPSITTLCGGCPEGAPWPDLPKNWSCINSNPDWVAAVQPWVAAFKAACPTAYSFPYDDPTSSFQCSSGTSNTMGYTITFCFTPAG